MGFSRQEYWSGLPFPSPGDLPNPGIESRSPTLQAEALTSAPPGKPCKAGLLESTLPCPGGASGGSLSWKPASLPSLAIPPSHPSSGASVPPPRFPVHPVPSPLGTPLGSTTTTGSFPLPVLPGQSTLKAALCPFFSLKKCVFDQFYNKTQTEFLQTTATRNN